MQSEITERAKRAWNSISDEHNQWDALSIDERETYIALTAALSDKQAGEVKIKPLEFNDDPCPAAVCPFGHYVINPIYSHVELLIGYGRMSMTSLGRVQLNPGSSIDDLQTAAQADYEQRIRSAICGGACHV